MAAIARCSDCGWTSKRYKTLGLASHGGRQHKCSRHVWRQEMAARVKAREEAEGPIRECHHPIANHVHGTHACYVLDKCRCKPCRLGNRAYENQRNKDAAYGRSPRLVDAEPVREHMRALVAQGMGVKRIMILAGLGSGTMTKIWYGYKGRPPAKRIRPETAAKILAVTYSVDVMSDGNRVDAAGTQRRLQALVYNGYSITALGQMLGVENCFHSIMHRETVQAATARKVRALFERLRDIKPPETTRAEKYSASRSRNYARACGWKPAVFWDDIDNDPDPGYGDVLPDAELDSDPVIDEVAIERVIKGGEARLTRLEKVVAAHKMRRRGTTETEIARILRANNVEVKRMLDTEPPVESVG